MSNEITYQIRAVGAPVAVSQIERATAASIAASRSVLAANEPAATAVRRSADAAADSAKQSAKAANGWREMSSVMASTVGAGGPLTSLLLQLGRSQEDAAAAGGRLNMVLKGGAYALLAYEVKTLVSTLVDLKKAIDDVGSAQVAAGMPKESWASRAVNSFVDAGDQGGWGNLYKGSPLYWGAKAAGYGGSKIGLSAPTAAEIANRGDIYGKQADVFASTLRDESSPDMIVRKRMLSSQNAWSFDRYKQAIAKVKAEQDAAKAKEQQASDDERTFQDTSKAAESAQWRRGQRQALDRQYAGRYTAGRAPQIYQAWRDREVDIRAKQSETDAAGDRDPRIARAGRELAASLRLENWETTAKALADAAKELADSAKKQAEETRRKALVTQREGLDLRRDTASDRFRLARRDGDRASGRVQEDEDKLRSMGLSEDMFGMDFNRLISDPRARQRRRRDVRENEQFGEHLNALAQGRRPRLSSRDWERFRDVSQAQAQRMQDLRLERKARQAAINSETTLTKVLDELKKLPHA